MSELDDAYTLAVHTEVDRRGLTAEDINATIAAELRAVGLRAVATHALREAAAKFDARLPDGTGNGRAYNSYTVAAMLREMAVSETSTTEQKQE